MSQKYSKGGEYIGGVALTQTKQDDTMEIAGRKRDKYGRPPLGYLTSNLSPSEANDEKAIKGSRPHHVENDKWFLSSQLRRLFGL